MRYRFPCNWMAASALAIAACHSGAAQTITGSVNGTVTDASGAAVPNATVTATNTATGVETAGKTNDSGTYSIRFLQIGQYKITVKQAGFQDATYGPFQLEVDQTAKVDAKLNVGGGSQTVTVTNEVAPILNTENATLGATFTANTIQNIPLNGRNFSSVTIFLPGSVITEPQSFTGQNAIERSTNGGGVASINGNRAQANNYLLDGIEINETINNVIGYNPNPDAIGEMKVISANAQAEYGNVNGGSVIAVTKSGTNQFHGNVFGFLENYNLNANSWKNNLNKTPKNPSTQAIFGGTIGGPIKSEKLFFFADYSGARFHQGGTSNVSVATQKMRNGDFSELLNCNGCTPIQLYDPANNYAPYVNNQGVTIRNTAAQYLFAHPEIYPLPNKAPISGSAISDNYNGPTKQSIVNNQGDVKIDWTPFMSDRISGRYTQGEAFDTSMNPLAITFPSTSVYPTKGLALNWVHTFSPAIVNEFRAGFTRVRWVQGQPVDSTGLFGTKGNSVLGIPGTQLYAGFSALNFGGSGIQDANLGNAAISTNFIDNTFTYGDNLTWQTGKHLFKFGAQFLRYQQNNFYPGNDGVLGQFNYNGNYTSNSAAGSPGFSFADFVLDRSDFVGIGGVTGRTGQRQWRSAGFAQDDWKIMPNLTLNLGVRYEFDQPIYEVNNKQANIDLDTATVYLAGARGAGAALGNSRALYKPTYTNLMPRIGFAWQPTNRWVLRGGYGTTTYLEGTGANLRLTFNPPFQSSFEANGQAPSATSPGVYFSVANGFTSAGNPNYGTGTFRAWDKNLRPSTIGEWNLTTEYQVSNSASITAGYIGQNGTHLIQAVALNQLRQPCTVNGVIVDPSTAACATTNPAPYANVVGQNGAVVGTLSYGMMNYNALQATYRQRALHGLEYTLNYTYGHAFTNTTGFFGVPSINGASPYAENAYDNSLEYGPAGQDVRHNLNGTLVYELPFGHGRMFGSNVNGFVDQAIGGWKLSATAIAYSGFPVTPNSSINNAFTNNRAQRPDQVRPLKIVNRSINHWFGTDASATACTSEAAAVAPGATCAFTTPVDGTYGNARVGSLRAPGFQQYDFSGFKDFPVYREYSLGFRVDAFNAFNIASYKNPDNTVQNSTFGQITDVRSAPRQIQFSANFKF